MKGFEEKTVMTMFWIIFALAAVAVFFLIAQFGFTRLFGVTVS